ncbi:FAD-dependent oxidoreductase [Eggerthella guodeyinii]|uniref:FAD-dependent oxidoreductase n=1 Tax=Eggerthella guodeyinii TaxID=2690837 RepID=A0A6L7IW96_9ACTN|nr:FAD-dependent oxidoreductase [Eggerthella guodeyinii]QOS69151.1 FAD-dependent oxidoreductase [Eggerthella guodeyinii]
MKQGEGIPRDEGAFAPSRRDFLKGAGVVAGGLTIAGMFAGLTGCSPTENGASGATERQTIADDAGGYPVIVHETDVVVVGGGLAGCTAARRVIQAGKTLAIVDKGRFGHSGTSGQNWGADFISPELAADGGQGFFETIVADFFGLCDQDWAWAFTQGLREGAPMVTVEKSGCVQQRNPDGSLFGTWSSETPMSDTFGNKVRRFAQMLHRMGADVYDYTMMVDIMQDGDGHCAGIVAIDLKTGAAHVFRAKETILATGVNSWAMKPSIMGPEDTGDGHAVLAKRGVPLWDMEMTTFDYTVIKPYSMAGAVNEHAGILTLNSSVWDRAQNSQGDKYCTDYFTSAEHEANPAAGFVTFELLTMQQIMGGESIYMDCTGIDRDHPMYPYGMMHGFFDDVPEVGYSYAKAEECQQACITSCGHVRQSATMETDIPGLYSAMQGLTYYGQSQAFGQGWVAGAAAAAAADEIALPAFDMTEVKQVLDGVYGHLTKEQPSNGIRAATLLESIRDNSASLRYPRDADGIKTAIDGYAKLRGEGLPAMYCASSSRTMNIEWKNAIEAEHVLMCGEAIALASDLRKETRPWFYRSDYPKIDNDNWFKNITCSYRDGSWTLGTEEVNASRIKADDVKSMLMDIDLDATI